MGALFSSLDLIIPENTSSLETSFILFLYFGSLFNLGTALLIPLVKSSKVFGLFPVNFSCISFLSKGTSLSSKIFLILAVTVFSPRGRFNIAVPVTLFTASRAAFLPIPSFGLYHSRALNFLISKFFSMAFQPLVLSCFALSIVVSFTPTALAISCLVSQPLVSNSTFLLNCFAS